MALRTPLKVDVIRDRGALARMVEAKDENTGDHCSRLAHKAVGGTVVAPGFGASDCKAGCVSHLRYLGRRASE